MLGFRPLAAAALAGSILSGLSASLSVTEGDDTLASSGTLALVATASITEADDTLSSACAVAIVAVASILEDDDTLESSAALEIAGTLGGVEDDDSLVSAAFQSAPLRIGVSASSKVGISCAVGSASVIKARSMQRPSLSARVT